MPGEIPSCQCWVTNGAKDPLATMYFGITPSGISYVTSKATAALPVSGWSRQRDRVVSCASD
jgi:hypothetical protein